VIASLNCVDLETWVEWAKKLEETGVQGLELNFFAIPVDPSQTAADIEKYQVQVVKKLAAAVKIPVSVKLSPFYTSPLNVVKQLDDAGAAGFVIFNRLWHPEIETDREKMNFPFHLSTSADHGLPIRYVGLLSEKIKGSLCASNGIHTGNDAVEAFLAGADVVQAVSTFYKNGVAHAKTMLGDIETWMDRKGYGSLGDFRGKLNYENSSEKWQFKRAQYVRHLLNSEKYINRSSAL
jgi:dihydroorotate dehydrogenase (fumarate)